jgi:AraC-like DNA-binding protein
MLSAHYLEHRFDKHAHDTYCLGVTLHGVQAFYCRGAHYASTPGHVIAFNPDEPHDGHSGDARAFGYRMLYVPLDALEEVLGRRPLARFAAPLNPDPELFALTVRAIAAIRPQESLRAQSLLGEAVRLAFDRFGRARSSGDAAARCDRRALRLRDYLESYLDTDVTGDQLAAIAGCSRIHVNRIFQRAFGMPPHAYLNSARIRRACELLRSGVTLAEAAVAAGFADQAHLSRRFKRILGVTPNRWRRIAGAETAQVKVAGPARSAS